MTDKVLVRFIKSAAPYNSGETAGFEPEMAKTLVRRKLAVYDKEEPVQEVDETPVVESAPEGGDTDSTDAPVGDTPEGGDENGDEDGSKDKPRKRGRGRLTKKASKD